MSNERDRIAWAAAALIAALVAIAAVGLVLGAPPQSTCCCVGADGKTVYWVGDCSQMCATPASKLQPCPAAYVGTPTPTPQPTPVATPSPTPTPWVLVTPTPAPPTPSPTATPRPTPTALPTGSPLPVHVLDVPLVGGRQWPASVTGQCGPSPCTVLGDGNPVVYQPSQTWQLPVYVATRVVCHGCARVEGGCWTPSGWQRLDDRLLWDR